MGEKTIQMRDRTVFILLLLIGLLLYVNALAAPFHFDDIYFIKENLKIKSLSSFLDWIGEDHSRLFTGRPVLLFTFLLNYRLGGLDTFGYHLLNLCIHVVNAFIFYLILFRFDGRQAEKNHSVKFLLAAVIFLVHPVNAESVTYLSSRSSALTTLFMLASLFLFLHATAVRFRLPSYLLSIVLYPIALFTKETAVILPALLLLFDYFFISREWKNLKARLKYHVPFLAILASLVLVYGSSVAQPEFARPWGAHIPTELSVFVEYGKLLFLPVGLTIDHEIKLLHLLDLRSIFSFALLAALVVLAIYQRKKYGILSFSLFWFLIPLAPFLAIRLNDLMAERWVYISSLGFAVAAAEILMMAVARYGKTVRIAAVTLLILFGGLTITRNQVYASPILLWEDAVRKAPEKSRPYLNLGRAYIDGGDLARGITAIEEGIGRGKNGELSGKELVAAHINLAAAYRDDVNKAEETLRAVAREAAGYHEYHHSLGLLFMRKHEYRLAIQSFTRALELRPASPTFLYLIGSCYEQLAQKGQARDFFEQATKGIAQNGLDYISQGEAFLKLGDSQKKMDCLAEAVKADPLDINTRLSLADALLGEQNYFAAWKEYSAAAVIAPGSSSAYRGLGIILFERGDRRGARRQFIKALSLIPADSPERNGLIELYNKT